jgi:hypothetical protein
MNFFLSFFMLTSAFPAVKAYPFACVLERQTLGVHQEGDWDSVILSAIMQFVLIS